MFYFFSYGFAVVAHVPSKAFSHGSVSVNGKTWKVSNGGKSFKIDHKVFFVATSNHGTEFLPRFFKLGAMSAPVPPDKLDTRGSRHSAPQS